MASPPSTWSVARIGDELIDEKSFPRIPQQWVQLLQRYLAPGGHIAELLEVTLEDDDGHAQTLRPGKLIPFSIGPDEATAYLGELTLQLPREED